VFLAVVRAGTLAKAARAIGQTQPVTARRLRALEQVLGQSLFRVTPEGVALTPEGSAVRVQAERIEAQLLAFERALAGGENALEGSLRVSCSEWCGSYLLAPVLAEFARRCPAVAVELLTNAGLLGTPRREFDLVLRTVPFESVEIISRRLVRIPYALYGAEAATPPGPAGVGTRVVAMNAAHAGVPEALWLQTVLPEARIVARSNSRHAQAMLCARGVGLAVLPKPVGDVTPGLRPIALEREPPGRELYLGYHRDLRRLKRLRELTELMVEQLGD
jgi:DNA-binding transcriptional LysR family regulator